MKHDDCDWSVSRHPLLRGAAHCWPSAGLLVCGQLAVVKSHLGNSDVVCRCGGTGDRDVVCSRLSSPVLGPQAGVAPAVHLLGPDPLAASPTQPEGESGEVLAELAVSRGCGEQTPMPIS